MRRLRILHIATHSGVYRGGAVQACRMAEGLARRGHEVTVMASESRTASSEERRADAASWAPLRDAGIRVEMMDYRGLGGMLRLRKFLRAQAFDIVHAHRDDALIAAWGATWGLSRPALVAQRGTETPPPLPAAHAFASGRVKAVVAVAGAVRDVLVSNVRGLEADKVRVIYGSVDIERFAPQAPNREILASLQLPAGAYVVGSLSAYRGPKGFKYLVTALKLAMQSTPGMVAVFLGNGVPEHVRPLAEATGLGDRFRFVGHQSDVAAWLSVMDVTVVAATRREGLSGVLRESLAAGVPVISTDCAGNREIVRDRETGLLVPVRNARALRDALLWAEGHRSAMREMAERGRAWVTENCSLERQAASLEELYEAVLAGDR